MTITLQQIRRKSGTQRTLTSRFSQTYLLVSDAQISEVDALNASTVSIADAHPQWASAIVDSIAAKSIDNDEGYKWELEIGYTGSSFSDPSLEPPVVRFGSNQYVEVVEKIGSAVFGPYALDSAPENSAGDPLDPPLQNTNSKTKVLIQQNMRDFDPKWINEYENSLIDTGNDGSAYTSQLIVGIEVITFQARMVRIEAVPKTYTFNVSEDIGVSATSIQYWDVTYTIEITSTSFLEDVLDQGLRYDDSGTIRRITSEDDDLNDIPVTLPVKLDGAGGLLVPPAADVRLTFFTRNVKDWAVLDIPRDPRQRNFVDSTAGSVT